MHLVDLLLALVLLIWSIWAIQRIAKKGWWHVPKMERAIIPTWISIVLFLLFLPFQIFLAYVWNKFFPPNDLQIPFIVFLSTLVYVIISLTPPFIQLWKRPGAYSFWKSVKTGFVALILVLPIVFIVEGLMIVLFEQLLGIPRVDQDAILFLLQYTDSPWQFVLVSALIAFAIPVLEELLFRGLLQNVLRRFLSAKFALPLTAIIFTLFHFSAEQGASNGIILPALFILALTLSWIYEKSGNLFASITLHSLFNIINICTLLMSHD